MDFTCILPTTNKVFASSASHQIHQVQKIETTVDEYILPIYILFEDHTLFCSKFMQQITRSKVHLTAAFQIADILTAPRLELTYAYEYFFLLAGIRKRSLRICFVHKR